MSFEYAISADKVGKCFQTYDRPVHRLLQSFYRNKKQLYEEFWALRDVSIDIKRGETIGLIGKNGSGKSTFLQLVAGTLTPSRGSIEVNGRISAILELGAGFNPQFTGIENARLNAAILGMSKDEINERLPSIVEFSELEDFVGRPVKTYSSGMYIRLAFSISINMDPDVLIIDEALAVGDVKFQRKCFRKIEELRNKGVTILFVTHATDSVVALCDRALFLQQGEVQSIGDPKLVVNQYLEHLFFSENTVKQETVRQKGKQLCSKELVWDPVTDNCPNRATYNGSEYRWGSGAARILDYVLLEESGDEIITGCEQGTPLTLGVAIYFETAVRGVVYGFTIKTIDGAAVFGTNSELKNVTVSDKREDDCVHVQFSFSAHLIPGEYFVSLGIVSTQDGGTETVLDRRYDLVHLKINGQNLDAFGIAAVDMEIAEQLHAD